MDGIADSMDVSLSKLQELGLGLGLSLVCCSPWGCKESDTTERLITFLGGNLNGHMLVSVCAVLA